MDRRRTLMTLAMASAALAPARGGEENGGSRALDGVWSVHVTPGPGSPPASPETDTLILYKNGMLLEDNGAVDNRGGQASGSGVQFGFYRFLGSGVFESVSWKVIAGLFGPALVKLQVTIEMLSATEYKG